MSTVVTTELARPTGALSANPSVTTIARKQVIASAPLPRELDYIGTPQMS